MAAQVTGSGRTVHKVKQPMDPLQRVVTAARHWWLGFWESLQLQRCVVLIVFDQRSILKAKLGQIFLLNGCIYGGSLFLFHFVLQPIVLWLLLTFTKGVYGTWYSETLAQFVLSLFHVFWLLPAYIVTLLVSGIWYQELATQAFRVRQEVDKREGGLDASSTAAPRARGSGLEEAAQELYRVIFFLIYYIQVWLISQLPFIGPIFNFFLLSSLYAYYCYDYKWSQQGVPLSMRLSYVEHSWPFYTGFGSLSALATAYCPFYVGAALIAVLFPVFILVACDSDCSKIHSQASLGRVPVFYMGLVPTNYIVRLLFGRQVYVRAQGPAGK